MAETKKGCDMLYSFQEYQIHSQIQSRSIEAFKAFENNDKNKSDKTYENARTTNNAALVSSSSTISQEDALSISFPQPPDPESLPPDTFRKLAQALYQRGDKAENRLSRKFFYNHEVTCNDGTSAGYYIRRNYQSKRWIVFLEGMYL